MNKNDREELKHRLNELTRKDMAPCPQCNSKNLVPQTPIKMEKDIDITTQDGLKKLLGAYARTMRETGGILEGPCFFMCRECGHKGPAVDCTGRTSEDVCKDPEVYTEMKRLWNKQLRTG